MKRALVTGITGQDGSYIGELLLEKGYKVYGMVRRTSTEKFDRIQHFMDKLELIQGDLTDQSSLDEAVRISKPDEVYNLGSQSFVPTSFNQPVLTAEITALGPVRLLESIRRIKPDARFYQASSSEMFGNTKEVPQKESTRFYPRSPYGIAKVYAHWITVNYRESYNLFTSSGILFNHESPRRGIDFVTRKITHTVAKIKLGLAEKLLLGNLEAKRDWGFAGDYVDAIWRMLQQPTPQDFVVATGTSRSVREFVEIAFSSVGLDWQKYVVQDPKLFRPADVDHLIGDASLAREKLGWKPKVSFQEMVKMMVEGDLKLLGAK